MTNKNIPLCKPFFDSEELDEIKEVLSSGWVSQGPKVKQFENQVSKYLDVKYAIAVTNCTSALHLSFLGIGLKQGDEAIVADFTFPATGHSVLYCGAKPVFVDIDPKTYNIDPNLIRENITDKTRCIIPVHTFGQSCNMDAIMEIANEYNLKVVEDSACAFGALYKNKAVGTIGDAGCFSFHARKGITTGEGGMVVTNNKELADKIRHLSVFGMTSAWNRESSEFTIPQFTDVGYNYKMSDITASIGVAQLRKIDKIIERKRELAQYWDAKLQKLELIDSPYASKDVIHIYQSYVALLDERVDRNKLIQKLKDNGVQTQIGTYASHIQPVYNSEQACPISLDISNRTIALPMYYTLQESDIDFAVFHIKQAIEELR